jgi:hypothetical protein
MPIQIDRSSCYHFPSYAEARAFADLHDLELVIDQGVNLDSRNGNETWDSTRFVACDRKAWL